MLTQIKDLDMKILNYLDDSDLKNICLSSKYVYNLTKTEIFWLNRILIYYDYIDLRLLKTYKKDQRWKDLYFELRLFEEKIQLIKTSGFYLPNKLEHIFLENVKKGNLIYTMILVNNGVDITYQNDIAIIYACQYAHLDLVEYLVQHGADINADVHGPLYGACLNNNFEMVKYLIHQGIKIDKDIITVINVALQKSDLKIVEFLIKVATKHGIDVNK